MATAEEKPELAINDNESIDKLHIGRFHEASITAWHRGTKSSRIVTANIARIVDKA